MNSPTDPDDMSDIESDLTAAEEAWMSRRSASRSSAFGFSNESDMNDNMEVLIDVARAVIPSVLAPGVESVSVTSCEMVSNFEGRM